LINWRSQAIFTSESRPLEECRYQEARGVVPTGYVDQGTVVRLMAEVLGGGS
jgi:hypothetical protein